MNWAYKTSFCLTSSSIRTCKLADFGFFGGGLTSDNGFPPSLCDLAYNVACDAACNSVCRTPSIGQNRAAPSSSKRRERSPKPEGTGPRVRGTVGSLPPLIVFCPRSVHLPSVRAFVCLLCRLWIRLGEGRGEISGERRFASTFPGRFHQTMGMPLKQSYLPAHRAECECHPLRPTQAMVFIPNLLEMTFARAPFLVENVDFPVVEFGLGGVQCSEVSHGELVHLAAFGLLAKAEIIDDSSRAVGIPVAVEETQEEVFGLLPVLLLGSDVVETQLGKLEKERGVGIQMGLETVQAFKPRINERKGNHRWIGGIPRQEHRKFVDEVTVGELAANGSGIALGRQVFHVDPQLLGEQADLFGLRPEEAEVDPSEDEIKCRKACADVFE